MHCLVQVAVLSFHTVPVSQVVLNIAIIVFQHHWRGKFRRHLKEGKGA